MAVVDVPVMERNLARMAALAAGAGIRLRPHAKTHKMPAVARRQLAHGATGLTVATLREAEVFVDAGVDDLLLAHPPVGSAKLRRLSALAGRLRRCAVALDSVELATALPASVDVYWEVDTGLHRIGTAPGDATVAQVQALIEAIGSARFRGLITHGGQSYAAATPDARAAAAAEESNGLLQTAALLQVQGIAPSELSIGATPTAEFAGRFQHGATRITEMRPGTYVFGDANQVTLRSQRLDDCALAVVATVVSRPADDRAVLDAGSKALSADLRVPGLVGYGIVLGSPDLTVARLSEEHALVTGVEAGRLRPGDRLVIVPAHVCTTINLHPAILFIDEAGATWQPVEARGWS
ncbi:MAG TPA: alanine racemase [Candidatus Limnocylindrales bacterium]|nr:alanine racemase [Candidatus Limnocylindrales bacterium]